MSTNPDSREHHLRLARVQTVPLATARIDSRADEVTFGAHPNRGARVLRRLARLTETVHALVKANRLSVFTDSREY